MPAPHRSADAQRRNMKKPDVSLVTILMLLGLACVFAALAIAARDMLR